MSIGRLALAFALAAPATPAPRLAGAKELRWYVGQPSYVASILAPGATNPRHLLNTSLAFGDVSRALYQCCEFSYPNSCTRGGGACTCPWFMPTLHKWASADPARQLKSDDTAAAISLRDALTRSVPTGRRFDGVGGFACVGGARLLYDYAEPQRGALLDALFSPGVGASYQILKTEIPGDMDSSYGSGPAYRHSAEDAADFQRGIYLPWLHQEAKRRNPSIKTCECRISLPCTCTCCVFL